MTKATQQAAEPQIEQDQQISLTFEQLQGLLTEANKKQSEDTTAKFSELVQAIIESKKPYADPRVAENEESFRSANRASHEAMRANLRRAQDNCPHVKGLAGQRPGSESSFWIHRLDTGEVIGICSFCQKVISSLIPEDQKFFALKGDNAPSGAGQRAFLHPIQAMTARFPEAERKVIEDRLNNYA
jgi:hypothetical protein